MDVNVPLQHYAITGYPTIRRMENFLSPGFLRSGLHRLFFHAPEAKPFAKNGAFGLALPTRLVASIVGEQTLGKASNALISLT